jgi:hypothetical protein
MDMKTEAAATAITEKPDFTEILISLSRDR